MPIIGVTNKGLSFPEIGRIKKGEMVTKGKKSYPTDLDYFKVEFVEGEDEAEQKFRQVYGEKPKEINIFLPFNEIDLLWDAFLESYTASRMIARSDGEYVIYRCDPKTGEAIVMKGKNLTTGEKEKHPEDNISGQDYNGNPLEYTPIGRLKVIIPELEEAAYMMLTTGSWHDIRNISQQLAGLKELNNGVIKGVPLTLRRSDQEVMAPIKGKKTRVTKSLLSIKADPTWVAARIHEDKVQAFPQHIASTMLEPGEILDEPYIEGPEDYRNLDELTPPDQWEAPEAPETPAEAPEMPSQEVPERPYEPEQVRMSIQKGIKGYAAMLEKDPDRYSVQVKEDGKIIASIVNGYIGSGKDDLFRYAIFEYLLGKGKGSTKTWTAEEIGTVKHLWLGVGTYGDTLGEDEEEELRRIWNFVQTTQGQVSMFAP